MQGVSRSGSEKKNARIRVAAAQLPVCERCYRFLIAHALLLSMSFFMQGCHQNCSLIPVEVKATDNATKSLAKLTAQDGKYPDIRYGIKLCNKNIGFNGKFYTFPYFLTFLLKRFVRRER